MQTHEDSLIMLERNLPGEVVTHINLMHCHSESVWNC